MVKHEIQQVVAKAVGNLKKKNGYQSISVDEILVERPKERIRGEYYTNIAFSIAKDAAISPFEAGLLLKEEIDNLGSPLIEKVEVVGGFVNFFVSENILQKQLADILKLKDKYGSLKRGKKKSINVEFISANPTGPLTLGNGRGGFGGDTLAAVLCKAGCKVVREYYINDTGKQIEALGHSVLGDNEAVYKGQYIEELKTKVSGKGAANVGEKAAKEILNKMIKPSVKKMGIVFDKWFSEKTLYKNKEVDKVIADLAKKGFTYESEGAIWFKSKDLGDDKDRVLVRNDGIKTYFASDIAYLKNKFSRGFGKLIIFLGADHHGYVSRLKAASHALGFGKDSVDALVLQLVRLFENGKEVRMSKRTGLYITIDELIDEVGLDAARFFFLERGLDTHMNFNMDLAKEQSDKNPVYKVQYAHARICSILKKAGNIRAVATAKTLSLLKDPAEIGLMARLAGFPEVVESTANDYQVQRLPQYATEVADDFHRFYEKCRVITDDKDTTKARIALVSGVKIILKNVLGLMGVSAPERMDKNNET